MLARKIASRYACVCVYIRAMLAEKAPFWSSRFSATFQSCCRKVPHCPLGVVEDTQGTGGLYFWVSCGTPKGKLPVPDVRFAHFRCHLIAEMGESAVRLFFLETPRKN